MPLPGTVYQILCITKFSPGNGRFGRMRTDKLLGEGVDHPSAEWGCTSHNIIVQQSKIEFDE